MTDEAWAAFEARLRAYVRRRVDAGSVDDVLADIMLRLVQHEAKLQSAENPMAWVLRVAANVITDHHRRRAAEGRALDAYREQPGNQAVAAEAARDDAPSELARCMQPLIRALPDPYAEALLLTEIKGVSQPRAARVLGISTSGMKSRVQRGRRKLRQALLRCCELELTRRGEVHDFRQRTNTAGNCNGCA